MNSMGYKILAELRQQAREQAWVEIYGPVRYQIRRQVCDPVVYQVRDKVRYQ